MVDTYPRKRPVQARARATVDAMIEAAARILADEGPSGLSTNRIAEIAGVSIGSLYQYFPSKEAIAAALVEDMLARDRELVARTLADSREVELRAALHGLVAAICRRQHAVAPILRHLFSLVGELERDELLQRELAAIAAQVGAFVEPFRAQLRPELREDDQRLADALFVAGHGLRGALNAATLHCPERLLDPQFVEMMTRQGCALLLPAS